MSQKPRSTSSWTDSQPEPEFLPAGTLLDGRFEIVRVLGEGNFAAVYEVRHAALHGAYAVKVLNPEMARREGVLKRFLSEGRIQSQLWHPNIVAITDIVSDPVPGLVMEYIHGGDLGTYLAALGEPPDAQAVLDLFLPILDALGTAHGHGIIHRDLKPQNILISRGPDGRAPPQPKVTDFGIAKVLGESSIHATKARTRADTTMGTYLYMSPEQIRASHQVDARSDIFSLGAILYEIATGAAAFDADSEFDIQRKIVDGAFTPPESLNHDLPKALAQCIRTALSPNPDQRFQSCEEFSMALRAASGAGSRVSTPPVEVPAIGASALPAQPLLEPSIADAGPRPAPEGPSTKKLLAALGGLALILAGIGLWAAGAGKSGLSYVEIPAGTFVQGCSTGDSECYPDEKPSRQMSVARFSMTKTPVTVEAYAKCLAAGACTTPDDSHEYCNWGRRSDHPVNCVDWHQAASFCAWAGGRLPSATEWEYAAKSGKDVIYPWGNEAVTGRRANYCDSNCEVDGWKDNSQNDGWATTSPVGSHPDGATPWGLLDMAGNVWEWTATDYGSERKEVRGGGWVDAARSLRASYRGRYGPTDGGINLGFRCVL